MSRCEASTDCVGSISIATCAHTALQSVATRSLCSR